MKNKKIEIVLATKNKHKLEEIQQICSDLPLVWLDLEQIGFTDEFIENGSTFEENALIKAKSVQRFCGLPVVADDSGLVVDALGGAPGIYSSRFSGPDATTEKNNALLLEKLKNVPWNQRTARFVCVAAFVDERIQETFEGVVTGKILDEYRGSGGFGYDPLFQPDGYTKTFAELGDEIKNKISHRARAFQKLKQFLLKYYFANGKE